MKSRQIIERGAVATAPIGPANNDDFYGAGRVNALRAVLLGQ